MPKRILIMGLPGAGKTTLAEQLKKELEKTSSVTWLNADKIREEYNDWDFTESGRLRQSKRMHSLAILSKTDYVIADFVAPLEQMRQNFKADWTIWVDTISEGRYNDTNQLFQHPTQFNFRVTEQAAEKWAKTIAADIIESK